MADLSKLIPCRAYNKIEVDKNYVGKTVLVPIIEGKDGTIICKGLPENHTKYICNAINNYYKKETTKPVAMITRAKEIVQLVIPGKPLPIEHTKAIRQQADGTFILCTGQEYLKRQKFISKNRDKILQGREHIFPIVFPIEVSFTFHLHEDLKMAHGLSGLIESGLDTLARLKVIKNKTPKVIAKIGSCRVEWTKGTEYTEVTINSIVEDKK
jgi:hypothetical protein